jgi:hypothetical protein
METNRDIYLAIAALAQRARGSPRTLEEYLRAVLALAQRHQARPFLRPAEFIELLSEALVADPLAFDPAWPAQYDRRAEPPASFADWRVTVASQVVDLREMADAGTTSDQLCYFGVSAPRGARWCNFDVGTYLECAVAGCYGGWEPGDPTGREFVPGDVAVLESDGTVAARDPRQVGRPTVSVDRVTWAGATRRVPRGVSPGRG